MEKRAEKSAARLLGKLNGSAFLSSKGDRERVLFLASERESEYIRHFKERANALEKSQALFFFRESSSRWRCEDWLFC